MFAKSGCSSKVPPSPCCLFPEGEGAFGNVKLVLHKPTGMAFALKCQGKQAIVDNELQVPHMAMRDRSCIMYLCGLLSATDDSAEAGYLVHGPRLSHPSHNSKKSHSSCLLACLPACLPVKRIFVRTVCSPNERLGGVARGSDTAARGAVQRPFRFRSRM